MPGAHDRRGFFKQLLRDAVQAADEARSIFAWEDVVPRSEAEGWLPEGELRQETLPAPAAQRAASLDDVRDLCAELGLAACADEAEAAARASIRLTRNADGSSRLGGLPDVPAGFEWPRWEGEELAFLGQVQLDELPESSLPRRGTLLFFFALSSEPSGMSPSDAGACHVVFVAEEATERLERNTSLPQLAVEASAELTLPLEPPPAVEEAVDLEAWATLREQLAALQGVQVEDRAEDYHALHRLLGYPDGFAQGMELDAQLVGNGVDLMGAEGYTDPRVDELEPGAASWRLLFQLSSDNDLGVSLGYLGRLYVWIREDDLRAGRFDDVRAFVR